MNWRGNESEGTWEELEGENDGQKWYNYILMKKASVYVNIWF